MKKNFAFFIIFMMMLSLIACGGSSDNRVTDEETKQQEQGAERQEQPEEEPTAEESVVEQPMVDVFEEPTTEESVVEQSIVDAFIEGYNATAPTPIIDAIEVDVTDKASGHYRTEFRLGAFKDSIAKTGKIGDTVIDIVNCGWQRDELRIYADGITREQAVEIVKYAAPIMDPDVPSDDIQDVLDYLSGINDYHNGYFGSLCMTFNEIHGELMLRTD